MFENILGHEEIISDLKDAVTEGRLPGSMLFYGDSFGGKLTTALELARVLSCREDGSWNCSCVSCKKHRLLENSNTLILSPRRFADEIAVCADTLSDDSGQAARYLFVRAVQKLLKQFDSAQWQNNDQILKKASGELEQINENLVKILPGKGRLEKPPSSKVIAAILESSRKLENLVKSDGIPIFRIRKMTYWVHTTNNDSAKIVILDSADTLGEGSRNALLKVLEEPPAGVYFILLSSRKEGIIPTILSRLRPYHFPVRSTEQQKQVIKRIFRKDSEPFSTLKDFFYKTNGIDRGKLKAHAFSIVESAVSGQRIGSQKLDAIVSDISDSENFFPFLEELSLLFQDILYKRILEFKDVPVHILDAWYRELNKILLNRTMYNQSVPLLFISYLYRIRK